MKPIHRSMTGLFVALVSVPVFMSLVACIPSGPMIGDPEKSRIDPAFNGYWIDMNDQSLVMFQPWDERTWLVFYAGFDFDDESCPLPLDADGEQLDLSFDELVALSGSSDESCFVFDDELMVFKAWRSKIGRQWFWTWDMKGEFDPEYGPGPHYWFSFRERRISDDEIALDSVDFSHDKFQEHEVFVDFDEQEPPYDERRLEKARKIAERVLRRNADDPDLYGIDDGPSLRRIAADQEEVFEDVIEEAVESF